MGELGRNLAAGGVVMDEIALSGIAILECKRKDSGDDGSIYDAADSSIFFFGVDGGGDGGGG